MSIDKTIIVIPGATQQELAEFLDELTNNSNDNRGIVMTNAEAKIFHLKDGQLFEVVTDLKEVKEWQK